MKTFATCWRWKKGWKEYFSSAKAVRELGYTFIPARDALCKAVEWYQTNGYVR